MRRIALILLIVSAPLPCAAQPTARSGAARAARLLRTGESFLASGDRGSAIGYFREAIQADPSSAAAYRALGEAFRARGSLHDARAILEAGLSRRPDDAPLWLALARTLQEAGAHDDAALAVRSLLARAPRHREALRLRATLARERGAWSEALTAYRAVLAVADEAGFPPEEITEARRYERALRILADPIDPVSAPRVCAGTSRLRRALARCR